MSLSRTDDELNHTLKMLLESEAESECVEFKRDMVNPDDIGEYISALSNSAALFGKPYAWLIWGVDNATFDLVGTYFDPNSTKVGNEELESWLLRLLSPKIHFRFHSIRIKGLPIVMLEVRPAYRHPVQFKGNEFIRIGSYKKLLKEFPEKERELWRIFDQVPFEKELAKANIDAESVLKLLDYPKYFDLLSMPLPEGRIGILAALIADEMILPSGNTFSITNLGAILFAKRLSAFPSLVRKVVRVIQYDDVNRISTVREQEFDKGYAICFEDVVAYITTLLPSNEVIGKAFRREFPMFPELAVRELVANAIIHQDFHATGTGPMVEIFSNRMEITNPGLPLINPDRFLDSPPRSRNETLASFMRRVGVCEERGSGVDKIVFQTEVYQLPAPLFETSSEHTRAVLFAHRELRSMERDDRIRACYLHACLRYVQRDHMTNTSLRERFGIAEKNSATASRLIRESLAAGVVAPLDIHASKKFMKYVPWWAK